jgi:hypothetical protein
MQLAPNLYEPITDQDLLSIEQYGLFIPDSFWIEDLAIKG